MLFNIAFLKIIIFILKKCWWMLLGYTVVILIIITTIFYFIWIVTLQFELLLFKLLFFLNNQLFFWKINSHHSNLREIRLFARNWSFHTVVRTSHKGKTLETGIWFWQINTKYKKDVWFRKMPFKYLLEFCYKNYLLFNDVIL